MGSHLKCPSVRKSRRNKLVSLWKPDKGYVLKDKVNTGLIELEEVAEDEPEEAKPDNAKKKTSKKNTNSIDSTNAAIHPEDFPVNASPYFIYVEKGSHTITILGKDANGKYTVPVRTFLTATGRTATLTPVGDFQIAGKEQWHCWGTTYSPYCSKYYGGLFFHGPVYQSANFGSLIEGSVLRIGTNASSGCLRTSAEAAYFIYKFCWVGTNVKIVNGSPLNRTAPKPEISTQYIDPATNQIPVAGIAFGYESKTVKINESFRAEVHFTPDTASVKDCMWSSANAQIASVKGSGNACTVTGLTAGSTVITATSVDGNFTARFTVIVVDPSADTPTTTETTEPSQLTTSTDTSDVNATDATQPSTSESQSEETDESSASSVSPEPSATEAASTPDSGE